MHVRDEIWKRTAALRIHGGRIDMAASLYPFAPQPWVDLSTGINPICWPVPLLPPVLYQRLPLAADMARMTAAAAEAYGLPANAAIVPVPGSEIAIRLLPRTARAKAVGILAPTYGSHAAAWRDGGAEVHELNALPELRRHDLETLVVVNPNNPDGRTIARTDLTAFAQAWTMTGRRLIVDEAFADVRPEASLLALAEIACGHRRAALAWQILWPGRIARGFCHCRRTGRRDLARVARRLAGVGSGVRDRRHRRCAIRHGSRRRGSGWRPIESGSTAFWGERG